MSFYFLRVIKRINPRDYEENNDYVTYKFKLLVNGLKERLAKQRSWTMETILPYHNYIVVNPNGDIEGFQAIEDANAYILGYYVGKIDKIGDNSEFVYTDNMTEQLENSVNISRELGVYEGDCKIYDLDSLIYNIQNSGIFDDEKEELISKLMEEDIDINAKDYQLEEFLVNTKIIEANI